MSWLNVTTFVEEKDILPPSYWTFYYFLFLRIECLVLPQPRTQGRIEYRGLQRGIPADTMCTGGQSSKYTMREFQLSYRTVTAVGQSVPADSPTDFYPGAKPKLWKGLNMGGKLKRPFSLCSGVHSLWPRDPTVISTQSFWTLGMPPTANGFIHFCYTCGMKKILFSGEDRVVIHFFKFILTFCFSLLRPQADLGNRGVNNYWLQPEIFGCLSGTFGH